MSNKDVEPVIAHAVQAVVPIIEPNANTEPSSNYKLMDELPQKCDKTHSEASDNIVIAITNTIGNMSSSVASVGDDSTTPSDSGIQILDSISSGCMNESLMSNNALELDSSYPAEVINNITLLKQLQESADALALQFDEVFDKETPNEQIANEVITVVETEIMPSVDGDDVGKNENIEPLRSMTINKSDIDNSNTTCEATGGMEIADVPDEMMTSNCSTFDTENIVYRRKAKKLRTSSTSSAGGPKKRVSFHEDILKNTKTDNIHIEHGFITYKGYSKKYPHSVARYSWYSQGDSDGDDDAPNNTYYRNACSDVLDYGNSDVYEQADRTLMQYDNSGVFEYAHQIQLASSPGMGNENNNSPANANNQFYQCKCSSSSSSLESGDSLNSTDDDNNEKRNYGQTKSNSCDCIGSNATNIANNNNVCTDNCYFSDPSIETNDDSLEAIGTKSVWRKEMKPKGSCLKKTKRQIGVIQEQDLATKMKKFNVHQLSDVNQLIGSLKNIFSLTLPERGVPEGCEDLQPVYECLPDVDHQSPVNKTKSFLSKSFDNGLQKKKTERPKNFVHAVDEQLRRNIEPPTEIVVPMDEEMSEVADIQTKLPVVEQIAPTPNAYRNKYIVNCESTVFEHTGVFYEYGQAIQQTPMIMMPMMQQPPNPTVATPFAQKLSNMFKSFRDSATAQAIPEKKAMQSPPPLPMAPKLAQRSPQHKVDTVKQQEMPKLSPIDRQREKLKPVDQLQRTPSQPPSRRTSLTTKCYGNDVENMGMNSMTSSMISSFSDKNSTHSNVSSTSNTTTTGNGYAAPQHTEPWSPTSSNSPTRHLSSPSRRRQITSRFDRSRLSPDLFAGTPRDPINPMDLISPEFDDLLTITTTETDLNESDIEILDYPSSADLSQVSHMKESDVSNHFLRPPSTKSSLINRFLRNVTQKKIQDATVKKNNILSAKYRDPPKNFGNLYVKTPKPIDLDMVADLNAEIALEIELNCANNTARDAQMKTLPKVIDLQQEFGNGVGEVCVDIFNGNAMHILRDDKEVLMKVFKLYTGYSLEGHMTPVLVFLTDKTLYVTDLVRNRLCNKFVLPYTELDVILIGPHGNTVLLSNSARDMQQVLLAGGPYPTDGLVSSLELCARRSGTKLPAIGQLTLDHLAPLQAFVRENSPVTKNDAWVYYAVVSVPANILNHDEEPLGPNIKGFLMHRTLTFSVDQYQSWSAGYFLLKAGVLYMFPDSNQKLPSLTICLSECKGARRASNSPRPHCFELILKTGFLQLAAPDEYVASDWLQSLVQSASGLFEMQEKHKTLGCTIVITSNHLITLRENFEAPLRRMNAIEADASTQLTVANMTRKLSVSTNLSDTCSNISTPTRFSDRFSSARSSPSRNPAAEQQSPLPEKSFSSISSIYGKNAGLEVKTCAALQEIVSIRVPAHGDQWWCILEFSCQEVQENSDDLVVFFATNSDMRRFLTMLETLWQTKKDASFPISIISQEDVISRHCEELFTDLNRAWEPLLIAALGYPQ